MWCLLAEKLGMSVRRCKREVSSAEFVRWQAFWRIRAMFEEQAAMEARMKQNMRS